MKRLDKNRLEKIVIKDHICGVGKVWDYTKAIATSFLPEKYQRGPAKKVGWSSATSTIVGACLGGSLSLAVDLLIAKNGSLFLDHVAQELHWTHYTYQSIAYGYTAFNVAQNLFRVGYALKMKKGIAAFCLTGALFSAIYIPLYHIKNKIMKI